MSTTTPHRNATSYMPSARIPLTPSDTARLRQDVIARGEAVIFHQVALMWDVPIDRVKSLTKDLRKKDVAPQQPEAPASPQ